MIEFDIFRPYQELEYGITPKSLGNMRVYGMDGITVSQEGKKNRSMFFNGNEFKVYAGLKHGRKVWKINEYQEKEVIHGYDALVTNQKHTFLVITVADCFPLYIYNPENDTIGIAHCGWKGVSLGIVENILNSMGGDSRSILTCIGPGLKKCHFEIQQDLVDIFKDYGEFVEKRADKTFLDLAGIIKRKCRETGVRERNIEIHPDCTYCLESEYFSFRRDKPGAVQAHAAYICKIK